MKRTLGTWTAGFCLLAACSSGSSGSSAPGANSPFRLDSVSFADGSVLALNTAIGFRFSEAVDFSSVSLNTIRILEAAGLPAVGEFYLATPETVVFQPACPTLSDFSDAGLQPLGTSYTVTVVGTDSGAMNTVRSLAGRQLETTDTRGFTTPSSSDPATWFEDVAVGPPVPVVRGTASLEESSTYVELGGDASDRVYLEIDLASGVRSTDPPGFELPLNLYADTHTRPVFVVFFNQPLLPAADNLERIALEVRSAAGSWQRFLVEVELVSNCAPTGAVVRVAPRGILPREGRARVVLLPGLSDLVGQSLLLAVEDFADLPVGTDGHPGITPPELLADELFEGFDFADLRDPAVDGAPARWRNGGLTARLRFDGTGGPGGGFDWIVRSGEVFILDTTEVTIHGGPDGTITNAVNFDDGLIDVDDLIIEEGAIVRAQGPNPLRIRATGDVVIDGTLDVSGFDAIDVIMFGAGIQESGAAGGPGGGRGGHASESTTSSTAGGGTGQGPAALDDPADQGGQGGESGYARASLGKDARRPGGGGGGRFAADACVAPDCDHRLGEFAEAGFDGHPLSTGATSGTSPARGGLPGVGPFLDGDASNDFFGSGLELGPDGSVQGLIRGELPGLWAGYGGGGGGDAIPSATFPGTSFPADQKGGAGGGGGGALHVQALGAIVIGPLGQVLSGGGRGANGENTIFLDHIGGTGGSGSGGHVVLESARRIELVDGGPPTYPRIRARGARRWLGPATSGGFVSYGGSAGPGVVQLHVRRPAKGPGVDPQETDLVVPADAALADEPLDAIAFPTAHLLNPFLGSRSRARSVWIPVGSASDSGGNSSLVEFLFAGIETAPGPDEGKLLTSDGPILLPGSPAYDLVREQAPLLGPEPLAAPDYTVTPEGSTLVVTGAALSGFRGGGPGIGNDIYLRTPALLRHFVLRVGTVGTTAFDRDFDVVAASYDEAAGVLRLTADENQLGNLGDHVAFAAANGVVEVALIPRFFRLTCGGEPDIVSEGYYTRILFQATGADALGEPDDDVLVDWTADVSRFNALAAGELRFFRFDVEFELAADGRELTRDTKVLTLDFLRVPFRF